LLQEALHPQQQRRHHTCTKHRSSRGDHTRPTPESSKDERQARETRGEEEGGEESAGATKRNKARNNHRSAHDSQKLSGSLENEPCHHVLASGGLTFQVRSCPHSTLDSKVFKKHSVDSNNTRKHAPDQTKLQSSETPKEQVSQHSTLKPLASSTTPRAKRERVANYVIVQEKRQSSTPGYQ
jgi:hypothetical protein